jgi:RNA polymerase nonessential primary-like sigma factor
MDVLSLNTPIKRPEGVDDVEAEIGDYIPDAAPTPEELLLEQDRHDMIQKYLSMCLNEREMYLINSRFGLLDGVVMTLDEIGKELNLSRERVRQIEVTAFRKIRRLFSRLSITREDL